MDDADLDNRFQYHAPPDQQTRDRHQLIRETARTFADAINLECPEGREKSLAMTHLEESMFWSNAAIARAATTPA